MISQLNSAAIRNAYGSNSGEQKTEKRENIVMSKQGDMSRVDEIKESLASGEYRIDLHALSKKIAEELL